MKTMKKLFSKIVTLVLLVAMLVPFADIPKVEAAEECNGEWEYHTNYYFFLQAEHPNSWVSYLLNGSNKTTTNYYTSFLYNFPSDGSKIEFLDEGFVKITDDDDYDTDFDAGLNTSRKSWSVGQFYYEFKKEHESSEYGDYSTYAYTTGDNKGTDSDRVVTYLFHGDWANLGNGTNVEWDLNNVQIKDVSEGLEINKKISKLVDASIIIDKNASSLSDVKIGAAGINNGNLNYEISWVQDAIETYNKYASSDDKIKYQETGVVQYISELKNPVINLVISRTYQNDDIFTEDLNLSTDSTNNTTTIEIDGTAYALNQLGEAEESYLTYTNGDETENISSQKSVVIEDPNGKDIAWFLAPTLYQMSYKVCKAANVTPDQVTVTYDGNEQSVETDKDADKVPGQDVIESGSAYTISTQKPTLEGYTFKKWNLSKDCAGESFEPGVELSNSLTNNTTLYACWGKTDTTDPEDTGVLTYAGLFTGVIALAGGAYYLVKKKNLFKKI